MTLLKSLLLLVVGTGVGVSAVLLTQRFTTAPAAPPKEELTGRSLDATLYVQASAEYRACCLQAYNLAKLRLEEKLAKILPKPGGKPSAVVLDLDETVFDNSAYQSTLTRSGQSFDLDLFKKWEADQPELVEPVPGALEFLAFAKQKGVALCFISNRTNVEKCHTVLKRMNIDLPEAQLKLSTGESDKTIRRAAIEKDFDVLLYVGDNLRDFEEKFRFEKDIEKLTTPDARTRIPLRNKVVDDHAAKFGNDWIILPNPMYGEWAKPFGRGTADLEFLRPEKK